MDSKTNTKKKSSNTKKESSESLPEQKSVTQKKFGILGKDISSRFNSPTPKAWKPTGRGGRNGQGKP
jgi:hypothetical protein